jgi:hypothetical protein
VLSLFDDVYQQRLAPADGRRSLLEIGLPGTLVSGYAHRRPGMEEIAA